MIYLMIKLSENIQALISNIPHTTSVKFDIIQTTDLENWYNEDNLSHPPPPLLFAVSAGKWRREIRREFLITLTVKLPQMLIPHMLGFRRYRYMTFHVYITWIYKH